MAVDWPISGYTNVQIAVGTGIDKGVETQNRFENIAAIHHHARSPNIVAAQELQTMVLVYTNLFGRCQRGTIGSNNFKMPINKGTVRMRIKAAHPGFESMGQKPIVGI